jgi:hypothetical protein
VWLGVLGCLVVGLYATRPRWVPYLEQVQVAWKQERLMRELHPPTKPAYSDDPLLVPGLLEQPGYVEDPWVNVFGFQPGDAHEYEWPPAVLWDDPDSLPAVGGAVNIPSLFRHGRTSPNGTVYLSAIGAYTWADTGGQRIVYLGHRTVTLIPWRSPGSLPSEVSAEGVRLLLGREQRLTLYHGQPDPADASHFTIAYLLDGQAGTIDGYVRDDGTIRLTVRDGALQARQPRWAAPPLPGNSN